MTLPPGVMESNPLSRGKNRLGVRSAKTALTGIEQAASKLERYGTLDRKLHLACGGLPLLLPLFRDKCSHGHATEVSRVSFVPYTFSLRLKVRREIPSSSAAF